MLYRVDVHAMWVSSKVLELLGPLPQTIEGGEIVRDKDGTPTGLFPFPVKSGYINNLYVILRCPRG